MKFFQIVRTIAVAGIIGVPASSLAALKMDIGKSEYQASCAVCHGQDGRGGGSFAEVLQLTVPDLTTLSRANGGVFPFDRVYQVIDGRDDIKAHGTREMPIWGKHFTFSANPEYDDYPHSSEAFVRSRIFALIEYIYRLQEK